MVAAAVQLFSGIIGLRSVYWIIIFYIVPIYLLKKAPILFGSHIYIYGNPLKKYRDSQWLKMIESEYAGFFHNKPRLMVGDFNDIKCNSENQGGIRRSVTSLSLFTRMLAALGLQDLKTFGGRYTWMGKRSKYTIMSKLDRSVANCDWMEMFPNAHVNLLTWIGSDHRPVLINTGGGKKKLNSFVMTVAGEFILNWSKLSARSGIKIARTYLQESSIRSSSNVAKPYLGGEANRMPIE